jgi:hypothetical protein
MDGLLVTLITLVQIALGVFAAVSIVLLIIPIVIFFEGFFRVPRLLISSTEEPDRIALYVRAPNERVIAIVNNSNALVRLILTSDTGDFIGGEFPVEMLGYSEIVDRRNTKPRSYSRHRIRRIELERKAAVGTITPEEAVELAEPLPLVPPGLRWWQSAYGIYDRYVRIVTGGLRFIGIPGFRRVRIDSGFIKITRYQTIGGVVQETWQEVISITNHVRTSNFDWPVKLENTEVAGGVPFNIKAVAVGSCEYPTDTMFTSDRWPIQLTNAINDAIREAMKSLRVEDMIASMLKDDGTVELIPATERGRKFEEQVFIELKKTASSLAKNTVAGAYEDDGYPVIFGIKIYSIQLIDSDPSNNEVRKSIQLRFDGLQKGGAYKIERTLTGEGDKAYLREIGEQLGTETGERAAQLETLKVLGQRGNSFIFGSGSGDNPIDLGRALFAKTTQIEKKLPEGDKGPDGSGEPGA